MNHKNGNINQIVGVPGEGKTTFKGALKEEVFSQNGILNFYSGNIDFIDFGNEIKKIKGTLKDGDFDGNIVDLLMKKLLLSDKHMFYTSHIVHYNTDKKKYISSVELEKKYKSSVIILLDSPAEIIYERKKRDIEMGIRNRVITSIEQIQEHKKILEEQVLEIVSTTGAKLYRIINDKNSILKNEAITFGKYYLNNFIKNEKSNY